MSRSSFTLIELIIVIVVAGILAAVMIPRLEHDNLRVAANQVIRHIQYTQHLAMVNDVYNAGNSNWYRQYWKVSFRTVKNCYTIYSDRDGDFLNDADESAIDPLTNSRLYTDNNCHDNSLNNDALLLQQSYGVDDITLGIPAGISTDTTDCSTSSKKYIAFDNLGRPHTSVSNSVNGIMKNPCLITLISGSRSAVIRVVPETGYVKLVSIN